MGIFSAQGSDLYVQYRATIRLRDRILGGFPNNPKLIEGWLFAKGVKDEEDRRQFALRTLQEVGHEVSPEATYEEVAELMENLADLQTQVFKRDEQGLYLPSYYVKAMLREAVSILWPDREWELRKRKRANDKTGAKAGDPVTKGFLSAWKERSFTEPLRIHFLRDEKPITEADGVDTRVGHLNTMQGPVSVINRNEYLEEPEMTFTVGWLPGTLNDADIAVLWNHCERQGLGASRSQDFGRFDLIAWDQVQSVAA